MLPEISTRVFLSRAQQRLFRKGVPVFMLHKIAQPPAGARDPFQYTRPEAFASYVKGLADHGLASVSIDSLLQPTERPRYALTFDDGYQNVFTNALPELDRQKTTSITFLAAALLGRTNEWDCRKGEVEERLMEKSQVQEWLAAGQLIGSHSLTHPNLKKLSLAEAREEIHGSKKLLEDLFGVPVRHFCYPSGKYTPQIRDVVAEAGYATACGVEFGVNPPSHPRFELRRIAPHTWAELLAKANHRLKRRLRNRLDGGR